MSPDSDDIQDDIEESYASSSKASPESIVTSKDSKKHYKTDEKQGKPMEIGLFAGGISKVPEMEGGGIDDDLFNE